MCQRISEGGRRCEVHKHTSIAVIVAAAKSSGLTQYQVERLFAELRREGRGSRRLSQRQMDNIRTNALAAVEGDEEATTRVQNHFNLGAEHDELSGATGYAIRLLASRASQRSEALNARFQTIADRKGLTAQEVKEKYDEYLAANQRARGGEYPPEYNQNTRRRASLDNLPYDVASVVALEKIERLGSNQQERRVQRVEAMATSMFSTYGYDDGRLEVTLRAAPDQVYAYQNVPEGVWNAMSSSPRPASIWTRSIRNNPDYQYANPAAADADAYATRCASCGQFAAAAGHSCPELAVREELITVRGLTGEEVREELALITENPEVLVVEGNEPVILPEPEILPAPETIEEVEAEAPLELPEETTEEAPTEAEEETPLLPLHDLEVQNVEQNRISQIASLRDSTYVSPVVPEGMYFGPVNVRERFQLLENYRDTTLEDQVSQERFNGEVITESTPYIQDRLASVYQYMRDEILRNAQLSDLHDAVRDSPRETMYGLRIHYDDNDRSIVYAYDIRTHRSRQIYGLIPNTGRHGYVTHLTPAYFSYDSHEKYSFEEAEERAAAAAREVAELQERDDVVMIEANSTTSTGLTIDNGLPQSVQPRLRLGRLVQIRKAFKEGKAIVLPVKVSSDIHSSSVEHPNRSGFCLKGLRYTVTGNVVARKNADGKVEIMNDVRSLKCYCREYTLRYECEHVNYVIANISNVIAQQTYVNPSAAANTGSSSLLTATLSRRDDVTVVTPDEGEAYISFGSSLPRIGNSEGRYELHPKFSVSPELMEELRSSEKPTFEQMERLQAEKTEHALIKEIYHIASPGGIKQALKRANTEVPTRMHIGNHLVSGSVTFGKNSELENAEAISHQLKCDCSDYQERYDCEHVRLATKYSKMILVVGTRTETPNPVGDVNLAFEDSILEYRYMADKIRGGLSEEEARAAYAEDLQTAEAGLNPRREQQNRDRARAVASNTEYYRRELNQNSETVEASNTYRERMAERWNNIEEPYTENPGQFYQDVKDAERRKAAGENPIEFRTENVTDGICDPNVPGSRKFGVELEFDFKSGTDRSTALAAIISDLKEAGLTTQDSVRGYHGGARQGWSDWSLEHDVTVAGELVSPILSDTPEHWEQLKKVCAILERHGAVASKRTGSHVHVSSGSYGRSTAKHAELLRQGSKYQELMFRLASNPQRGKHRGDRWCPPNTLDQNGDYSQELMEGARNIRSSFGHASAINMSAASNSNYKRSHVEFRAWDGSLDPAVIQQQVVFSAAMTDLAEREVIQNGGSSQPAEKPRKHGKVRATERVALGDRGTHTEETFKKVNDHVGGLIDGLVRTPEQRKGLASLFAITNWQQQK